MRIELPSVERTLEFGRIIGRILPGGLAVGLVGPLGSGKTHLVKGIGIGNGLADATEVTSPTFTLVQEYSGRLHLYHIDVYRLKSPGELSALGFDEMLRPDSGVIVEWADRVESLLPVDRLRIELIPTGPTHREARLEESGPISRECLSLIAGQGHSIVPIV